MKKYLLELIEKHIPEATHIDASNLADEIIKDGLLLMENDFDSTIVNKGYYYLCKFESGNFGQVWYNYHGDWMYNHKEISESIVKVYTPRIK